MNQWRYCLLALRRYFVRQVRSQKGVSVINSADISYALADKVPYSMFLGGCVIILGAILAATSMSLAQIVLARFILGGGIAIMTVGAPAVSSVSFSSVTALANAENSTLSRLRLRTGVAVLLVSILCILELNR